MKLYINGTYRKYYNYSSYFVRNRYHENSPQFIYTCSEAAMVKHEIRATRLRDSGNYSCSVENKYGSFNQYAWYEVRPLPLSVSIPNRRHGYVAEENQPRFTIPCIVKSPSKYRQFQIKWLLNDTEILPDGKIYNVSALLKTKQKLNAKSHEYIRFTCRS